MAHDVFISHCSEDKPYADSICSRLEGAEIRCWVAPRDITPGKEWGEEIMRAISESRVMIVVFSSCTNSSKHVSREVERAIHRNVVIVPFRVENVEPQGSLEYYLSSPHWLDALTPPLEKHLESLCATVSGLIPVETRQGPPPKMRGQRQAPPLIAAPEAPIMPQQAPKELSFVQKNAGFVIAMVVVAFVLLFVILIAIGSAGIHSDSGSGASSLSSTGGSPDTTGTSGGSTTAATPGYTSGDNSSPSTGLSDSSSGSSGSAPVYTGSDPSATSGSSGGDGTAASTSGSTNSAATTASATTGNGWYQYDAGSSTSPPTTAAAEDNYQKWDDVMASRALTTSDLQGLTAKELALIRNTPYAIHGYIFARSDVAAEFDGLSWYHPITSDVQTVNDSMNDMERTNVVFITQYQQDNNLNW